VDSAAMAERSGGVNLVVMVDGWRSRRRAGHGKRGTLRLSPSRIRGRSQKGGKGRKGGEVA